MQTRSMTRKLAQENSIPHFDVNEYNNFHNNRASYNKEQERRRLAGIKPIIICMGGPYSDVWYPPHN
jgi:hypothetical protein|tara:strand:+ start:556 stop:756 length:201 start_codon:yes stop_codon:yes gene_type:complete